MTDTHEPPPTSSEQSRNVEVSLVIPLFNEEESLQPLMDRIREAMQACGKSYEVIFVDDGSTDGSMAVLQALHRAHAEVRVIEFRRNFGKAAGYSAGFKAVRGDIVITMDADLQDDPFEIPNLIAKLDEGFDLVSGWKKKRLDPLGKTLPSKFFNRVTRWVSGIRIHDFNCGLKAYRSEVVRDITVYGELHRYIPVLAHMEGYRVGEIPVQHHERQYGTSKYGWSRMIKGFLDLLTVMFTGRYMRRPLHLFGSVGILFGLAGTAVNGYIATIWFQTGSIQSRHPLLNLGVLLTVLGVQFVCTGLLADMVARANLSEEKYNIRRTLDNT